MDSLTAQQGTEFFTFTLSYNEILFIGWFLGIMEALLVKKVKIDWGYAFFNLLLVICFWYIIERFVRLGLATSFWGDAGYSVTFLVLGYGAYKAFIAINKFGLPAVIEGFKRAFYAFTGKTPPPAKEETPDPVDQSTPGGV